MRRRVALCVLVGLLAGPARAGIVPYNCESVLGWAAACLPAPLELAAAVLPCIAPSDAGATPQAQGWFHPNYVGLGVSFLRTYVQAGLSPVGLLNPWLHCACREYVP